MKYNNAVLNNTIKKNKNYEKKIFQKKTFIPPMRSVMFRVNATKGVSSLHCYNKKSVIAASKGRFVPFYVFDNS
jgi:hypothetical protein